MDYSLNPQSSLLHFHKCTNFLWLEKTLPGPPGLQFPFSEKLPKCVWASLCIYSSIPLSVNSLQCGLYPYSLITIHTQRSPGTLPTAPISLVCGKSWMCQPAFTKEILFSWWPGRGHHPALFLVSLTLLHSLLLFLVLTYPRFPKLSPFLLWLYILFIEELIEFYACEYCLCAPNAWQEYGFEVRPTYIEQIM